MFNISSQILRVRMEIKPTGNQYNGLTWQIVSWTKLINLEHFIVWMRTAGLPSFRKLYGVINQDLNPGTYSLAIANNYAVTQFNGHKTFVLSTTNMLGG